MGSFRGRVVFLFLESSWAPKFMLGDYINGTIGPSDPIPEQQFGH